MHKRKRLASLIVVFAMILQMFSGFNTSSNAKEVGGVVKKATLTHSDGSSLDGLHQYSTMQLNVDFELPNNSVKKDDTTTIELPEELRLLEDQTFDIKTPDKKHVIAKVVADKNTGKLKVTYTDYPEKYSDVKGKLYVGVGVDSTKIKKEGKIQLKLKVNGEVKIIGDYDYQKVGDDKNEQFTKYGWQTSPKGTELQYRLRVNSKAENFKNVVVGDELKSNGLEYDKGSFRIYKGKWKYKNKNFVLEGEKDVTEQYKSKIKFTPGNRGFSIDFGDINNGEGYKVAYSARVTKYQPQNGERVYNNAWMKSNDKYIRKTEQFIAYQFAGGSGEGYNFSIRIFKKNENGQGLAGAKFKVVRDATGEVVGTITTDNQGYGSIKGLLKDNYTLTETEAPKGYEKSNQEIKVKVSDFDGGTKEAFKQVVNKKTERTYVEGRKIWKDGDDQDGIRPKEIEVILYANGDPIQNKTVKPDAKGDWNYKFDDLPKYDNQGKLINYTVKEEPVQGYTTTYEKTYCGYNITNEHKPETVEVKGDKKWLDDNDKDKKRPNEITIGLYADHVKIQETKATKANNWEFKFENLPKYKKGKKIEYTVKEEPVEGYTSSIKKISDNVYQILNTITGKISIPVNKTWVGPKQNKAVVKLFANGVEKQRVELNEANNWSHTFSNLPKYDDQGKKIAYTLKEEPVQNYDSNITGSAESGFTVKNTNNEKVKVPVEKTWVGPKQKSVTVRLFADGVEKQHVELSAANNWKHEFTNLPKYNDNGTLIKYTVKEDKIAGYNTEITGDANSGYKIKNVNVEKTQIPVEKTWVGPKTNKVTVRLYADGVEKQHVELSAANNWKHIFKDLPKYNDNGSEIKYTVKEDKVANYDTDITGNAKDGFKIKNSNNEKVKVPVEKTWVGPKQSKVTVRLFADGVEKQRVELSEANNWKHEFKDLPKYRADGSLINYTVKEDAVANYDTDITGNAKDGFKIKNSNNEKVKVPVEKTWVGPKQSKVTVRLFADGKEKQKVELSAANNWKHEFKDLPKYNADGSEIKYTVKEDKVANYDTDITGNAKDGFKIKNSNNEKVKVPVEKTWVGPKQKSVTVRLFADGVEKQHVELSEANNWKHEFKDLPKYNADGSEIKYTVKEDKVANYDTDITGNAKDGFKIKNTNVEKTKISVNKTWVGPKADKAVIKLLADGVEKERVTLSEANNWKHTFENLPKYDSKTGKEIKYEIKEEPIKNYRSDITGNAKDGFTVKNTNVEKVKIPVVKKWIGKELDSVTINLYANGKKIDEVKLSKSNGWKHTFENLPKYDLKTGKEIKYTIDENKVTGYKTEITGDATKGFTVINKEIPPAKTGDDSNSGIYGGLMGLALAGILGAGYVGRRRKEM